MDSDADLTGNGGFDGRFLDPGGMDRSGMLQSLCRRSHSTANCPEERIQVCKWRFNGWLFTIDERLGHQEL
jgi:hypothetical protein